MGDQDTPLEFNTATISSSNDTSGPNQTGRMDDDTYFGGISNNIIVFVSHESFNNIAAASVLGVITDQDLSVKLYQEL